MCKFYEKQRKVWVITWKKRESTNAKNMDLAITFKENAVVEIWSFQWICECDLSSRFLMETKFSTWQVYGMMKGNCFCKTWELWGDGNELEVGSQASKTKPNPGRVKPRLSCGAGPAGQGMNLYQVDCRLRMGMNEHDYRRWYWEEI